MELKPCPFCGGDVEIVFRSASKMHMVYHKDGGVGCYIAGPFKIPIVCAHSLKEAAEAWNRRTNNAILSDLPAVEAVPVVHARWIASEIPSEKYVCSNCGGACWYYDYQAVVAKSSYCPTCGAKMDGERREAIPWN